MKGDRGAMMIDGATDIVRRVESTLSIPHAPSLALTDETVCGTRRAAASVEMREKKARESRCGLLLASQNIQV